MATYPLIQAFDDKNPLGHVVIDDDTASYIQDQLEFLEILPILDGDGNILFFSIMPMSFEEAEDPI